MSNYPAGSAPVCPDCKVRPINSRGAKRCAPCERQRVAKPLPITDSHHVTGNTAEITKVTAERVRTLADLIRVCEIDTTEWEVREWTANKWEMGSVNRKSGATETTPLFQIKASLRRRVLLIAAREEITALIAEAKSHVPVMAHTYLPMPPPVGHMLELSIPDLHMGKLAWGKETGHANYDTHIAEALFDQAVQTLVARTSGYAIDQVLLTVGNDILHTDGIAPTTTAGTLVDTDGRFQRSFGVARRMVTRAIRSLATLAPVHVLLVPGNHDTLAVWHLGDSLECLFHEHPRVTIDNAPTMRKYKQYGKVMLLFTHGHEGKRQDYPLVMATEQPLMFGTTVHREAHTGHRHTTQTEEYHGVRVRISPALCSPDAWHAGKMFVGNLRAAEAFVWHKEEGLVGMALFTVTAAPLQKAVA